MKEEKRRTNQSGCLLGEQQFWKVKHIKLVVFIIVAMCQEEDAAGRHLSRKAACMDKLSHALYGPRVSWLGRWVVSCSSYETVARVC